MDIAVTVAVKQARKSQLQARIVFRKMEASAGFEPAVEVLQTSALPLG
jgi:hypothetical protein